MHVTDGPICSALRQKSQTPSTELHMEITGAGQALWVGFVYILLEDNAPQDPRSGCSRSSLSLNLFTWSSQLGGTQPRAWWIKRISVISFWDNSPEPTTDEPLNHFLPCRWVTDTPESPVPMILLRVQQHRTAPSPPLTFPADPALLQGGVLPSQRTTSTGGLGVQVL